MWLPFFFGCCAVGSFQGLSLACLVCLLLFVKCFVSVAAALLLSWVFLQGLSLACLVGLLLFVMFSVWRLLFCACCLWLPFFGEVGFVSGPVTGLLGRAGDFSKVVFVVGLRICLLCLNATFLVQLDFV